MKKLFLFTLTLLILQFSYCQQNTTLQPTETNSTLLKDMTLDQKSWVSSMGFPLNKYDFNNSEINLNLEQALTLKKKSKTLITISYIGIGASTIVMFAANSSGMINASAILFIGSSATWLIGFDKLKKSHKKVSNASYLLKGY